jgi:hypothetical protein
MGLGYGATVLGELPFLKDLTCLYWGDLDTHGFAILNSVRKCLPKLKSILMDEQTLLAHESLWGLEQNPYTGSQLSSLTSEEEELYKSIKDGKWGKNIRLEQERIAWHLAWPIILREATNLY